MKYHISGEEVVRITRKVYFEIDVDSEKEARAEFLAGAAALPGGHTDEEVLSRKVNDIRTDEEIEADERAYTLASDKIYDRVEEHCKKEGEKVAVYYSAYEVVDDVPVDNLDDVPIKGKIKFVQNHDEFWGKGKHYVSEVVESPTWLDICVLADEMIKATGDFHHHFLEGVGVVEKEPDGTQICEFFMGS
jgi:hypothetical protein